VLLERGRPGHRGRRLDERRGAEAVRGIRTERPSSSNLALGDESGFDPRPAFSPSRIQRVKRWSSLISTRSEEEVADLVGEKPGGRIPLEVGAVGSRHFAGSLTTGCVEGRAQKLKTGRPECRRSCGPQAARFYYCGWEQGRHPSAMPAHDGRRSRSAFLKRVSSRTPTPVSQTGA